MVTAWCCCFSRGQWAISYLLVVVIVGLSIVVPQSEAMLPRLILVCVESMRTTLLVISWALRRGVCGVNGECDSGLCHGVSCVCHRGVLCVSHRCPLRVTEVSYACHRDVLCKSQRCPVCVTEMSCECHGGVMCAFHLCIAHCRHTMCRACCSQHIHLLNLIMLKYFWKEQEHRHVWVFKFTGHLTEVKLVDEDSHNVTLGMCRGIMSLGACVEQ